MPHRTARPSTGSCLRRAPRPTIIAAQLSIEHWHGWNGDATIADGILDRQLHHAHRLMLKVESLRRAIKEPKSRTDKSPNVTD